MAIRTLAFAAVLAASIQLSAQEAVEGLPSDAPRIGTVITIDVSTNQA